MYQGVSRTVTHLATVFNAIPGAENLKGSSKSYISKWGQQAVTLNTTLMGQISVAQPASSQL